MAGPDQCLRPTRGGACHERAHVSESAPRLYANHAVGVIWLLVVTGDAQCPSTRGWRGNEERREYRDGHVLHKQPPVAWPQAPWRVVGDLYRPKRKTWPGTAGVAARCALGSTPNAARTVAHASGAARLPSIAPTPADDTSTSRSSTRSAAARRSSASAIGLRQMF